MLKKLPTELGKELHKKCKAMIVPVLSMKQVLCTNPKCCLRLGTFKAALNSPGETCLLSTSRQELSPGLKRIEKGQRSRWQEAVHGSSSLFP